MPSGPKGDKEVHGSRGYWDIWVQEDNVFPFGSEKAVEKQDGHKGL